MHQQQKGGLLLNRVKHIQEKNQEYTKYLLDREGLHCLIKKEGGILIQAIYMLSGQLESQQEASNADYILGPF